MSNSVDYSLISKFTPEVSVICVTYNHVNYIKECLDAILKQETNFDFQVIVHDDASTDGTQEIVAEYAEKFGDKILLLQQRENQYSKGNKPWWNIIPQLKSKFYAMCEGDDFWISPKKLQMQYDLMMADTSCSICFHNLEIRNELNNVYTLYNKEVLAPILQLKDLLVGANFIGTASVMYRNDFLTIPEYFFSVPYGDYVLNLHHASKGKICYIPDVMGVYRISSSSSHTSLFYSSKGKVLALEKRALFWKILSESDLTFSDVALDNYKMRLSELLEFAIQMGDRSMLVKHFQNARRLGIYNGRMVYFRKILRTTWNSWMN